MDTSTLTVTRQPSLADRYTAQETPVFLTGVQALVRVILERQRLDRQRGLRTAAFVSGYEGSPLGGFDLELGRRKQLLDEHDVKHQPGVNEELAATSVAGTQLVPNRADARHDGVVGYWYGKAPGLDRATDALRHANFGGTHHAGGAVALVGDDPSCKSSTVPSASEQALAELAIPTFFPADSQEILDFGLHAVALSRVTGLWAGIKIVTNVADGASDVLVPSSHASPLLPELEDGGRPFRHTPTSRLISTAAVEAERSAYGPRMDGARAYIRLNNLNVVDGHGSRDRIGIVAAGKTYLDVRQALDMLGLDAEARERHGIRLLKLGLLFPLEPTVVRDFAAGLQEILVIEEKRPFVEVALKSLLYGSSEAPQVLGKRDVDGSPLVPADGELDADRLAPALGRRLAAYDDMASVHAWIARQDDRPRKRALPMVVGSPAEVRAPYFCSGCPHSRSTQVPEGSVVGAGIGCHSMVLTMDAARVGDVIGLTQMGGEGAQWIGMEPFVETPHLFQNIGDGTFAHSGSLALRAAVAAKSNLTYKLLYNSAVAMTGGQQAVGQRTVTELSHLLHAEGVARTIITTDEPRRYRRLKLAPKTEVWARDRLDEAQRALAATAGVTVLIHDQQCATEKRRDRKRAPSKKAETRVVINERVCEGCGDCGAKSNCLSVEPVDTEYGRKTRIHQASCNTDYACLDGDCPSFLTVLTKPRKTSSEVAPSDAPPLPEPRVVVRADDVAIRITGIGGTGVVTVAQILANAAHLAGWHVRSLDQTGLSQKAGPVLSDIKMARKPIARANKLGDGECDLYLGCDLLVAADPKNLAVADPSRTAVVVSSARMPTGRMVSDPTVVFPDVDDLSARIRAVTRADAAGFLDARHLAETECGADQYANVVMLGAAYQAGTLPLPLSSLEDAIRLNGVAVEQNLHAFATGRRALLKDAAAAEQPVKEPAARTAGARAAGLVDAGPETELARIVQDRCADLVAYQSASYAKAYAEQVERVRSAESDVVPGSSALAEAVAAHLYKLMAYKDEYEVARLSLEPTVKAQIEEQFGADARFQWRFHPPVLRAMGVQRKIALGRWATPLLITLRAARRVRGTPIDVFGLPEVRRTERRLIAEYRAVIDELLEHLRPDNHALAVEIAALPDMVRGYEHIKVANVERYHERLSQLRADYANASGS